MGKREVVLENHHQNTINERVDSVVQLVRKQAQQQLTVKQEKYCNKACVERFLKVKGNNVKKAAKQLKACLSWRQTISTDTLIADEFSAELAEGIAYVAGYDDESRPVLVFRFKQDYQKLHSQKLFTRLIAFTLEVAIGSMLKNVEQFVLLFDASFFRSGSAFMNLLLPTLKIVAEYYPGRLYKAFVIDPPSVFSYLWKGVGPFVELSTLTNVVSSFDFEQSLPLDDFSSYPSRAASLRFEPSSTAKIGSCSSSRFSFTVSQHLDSLKPWHLSLTDTSSSKVGPALISPVNARSFSFASSPRGEIINRKSFFPSTPLPQRSTPLDAVKIQQPRTPHPSFFQSPAMFFKKKDTSVSHVSKAEKSREAFLPFLKFYQRPYDEMVYRSKMRPPLGGLISIVRRHHVSLSQRF
ncbi:hypothetical protein ACFE04_015469 [Oxalis oulophora]